MYAVPLLDALVPIPAVGGGLYAGTLYAAGAAVGVLTGQQSHFSAFSSTHSASAVHSRKDSFGLYLLISDAPWGVTVTE